MLEDKLIIANNLFIEREFCIGVSGKQKCSVFMVSFIYACITINNINKSLCIYEDRRKHV